MYQGRLVHDRRKIVITVGLFLVLLCWAGSIIPTLWLRDQGRTPSEFDYVRGIYQAITLFYPAQNNGKFPPANWQIILEHCHVSPIPPSIIKRCVYNDSLQNDGTEDGDPPVLILVDYEQEDVALVMSFNGTPTKVRKGELISYRSCFSIRAWDELEKLLNKT